MASAAQAQLPLEDVRDMPKSRASSPARLLWTVSRKQLLVTLALVAALVWTMWATREIMAFGDRKIVAVRLTGIINEFVEGEVRGNSTPEQITKRTADYMRALEAVLKVRSDEGQTVLVAEAVVSSSAEDITDAVRSEVGKAFNGSTQTGSVSGGISLPQLGMSGRPPLQGSNAPSYGIASAAPPAAATPSGSPLSPFGGATYVPGN